MFNAFPFESATRETILSKKRKGKGKRVGEWGSREAGFKRVLARNQNKGLKRASGGVVGARR